MSSPVLADASGQRHGSRPVRQGRLLRRDDRLRATLGVRPKRGISVCVFLHTSRRFSLLRKENMKISRMWLAAALPVMVTAAVLTVSPSAAAAPAACPKPTATDKDSGWGTTKDS